MCEFVLGKTSTTQEIYYPRGLVKKKCSLCKPSLILRRNSLTAPAVDYVNFGANFDCGALFIHSQRINYGDSSGHAINITRGNVDSTDYDNSWKAKLQLFVFKMFCFFLRFRT